MRRRKYVAAQVKGIVGLELRIERLEGKWKLNQNRSEADRRGVVDGLGRHRTPESAAMQELVKKTLDMSSVIVDIDCGDSDGSARNTCAQESCAQPVGGGGFHLSVGRRSL